MWDFFETVRHRHSVRQYQPERAVERNKLHAILEAACAAPSAGDLQSYRIVVVTEAERRRELSEASRHQDFIASAPVSLVFLADGARARAQYGERGANLFAVQDATIAASYAQLACVAAGLGSTWVGEFDDAAVRRFWSWRRALRRWRSWRWVMPRKSPNPRPAGGWMRSSRTWMPDAAVRRAYT